MGLWRPYDDNDFSKYANIQKGYFDYIKTNWNGVSPFSKHIKWDSVRLQVDERVVRMDNRIMAWKTPGGKLAFALPNRTGNPFTFKIDAGSSQAWAGHHYDKNVTDQALPSVNGQELMLTLPAYSIQIWEAQ
ncbi:hypothetical protein [Paenibacillus herberti]|uniref:Alpha-amylase/branching enzyme C-terminal all beta domain-containing protein n=1 Tax=Paenibacillus herberti TaxID=1619309 RepID=A0A229P2G1_9BACL|nr:hypothetical protein [Paenibacillus herberti]OXM16267.1 hypothetical protein CGZ75_06135 [Paenibacillus herberti]